MQVHAASERMLGGENHDWLRKAKPFQLRFINTNLRLYHSARHYNHSNELLLIIMDTNLKKYPGTIMPPADLWCDDVLFSTTRCCRNQGKNILNHFRSFNVISLSRHQLRGASSLKRLVLA